VVIPIFLNSLDTSAQRILVFFELVAVMRLHASYLLNALTWTPKIKRE